MMTNTVSAVYSAASGAFTGAFDGIVAIAIIAVGILIVLGLVKRFFGGRGHRAG